MDNNTFTYQYSVKSNREVESIRKKYLPKQASKLDTLRELDRRAQSAGQLHGLCLGIGGCLVFGVGMCFGLDVLPGAPWLTLLFGIIGAVGMIAAFPISRHISKKIKAKLTPKILALSEQIINSK